MKMGRARRHRRDQSRHPGPTRGLHRRRKERRRPYAGGRAPAAHRTPAQGARGPPDGSRGQRQRRGQRGRNRPPRPRPPRHRRGDPIPRTAGIRGRGSRELSVLVHPTAWSHHHALPSDPHSSDGAHWLSHPTASGSRYTSSTESLQASDAISTDPPVRASCLVQAPSASRVQGPRRDARPGRRARSWRRVGMRL